MGRTGFNKFICDYDTLHPFLRLISYSCYDLLSVSGRQLMGRWERLHRAWMQTQQRKDDPLDQDDLQHHALVCEPAYKV